MNQSNRPPPLPPPTPLAALTPVTEMRTRSPPPPSGTAPRLLGDRLGRDHARPQRQQAPALPGQQPGQQPGVGLGGPHDRVRPYPAAVGEHLAGPQLARPGARRDACTVPFGRRRETGGQLRGVERGAVCGGEQAGDGEAGDRIGLFAAELLCRTRVSRRRCRRGVRPSTSLSCSSRPTPSGVRRTGSRRPRRPAPRRPLTRSGRGVVPRDRNGIDQAE
ncbi:hypothetical protein SAMN05421505_1184 [Sinosporangium album]|uniref:Uncharacterized protein n=1 Tax=Sinosporangium album TaxID=504805 RepID=A0A1G8DCF7_9ACTN|nr:hypothetical protein SAMN05421505_1184 [Sinosporangium album]